MLKLCINWRIELINLNLLYRFIYCEKKNACAKYFVSNTAVYILNQNTCPMSKVTLSGRIDDVTKRIINGLLMPAILYVWYMRLKKPCYADNFLGWLLSCTFEVPRL